jgi:hypothetical protein
MRGGRLQGAGLGRVTAVLCVAALALTACGTVIKPYPGATNAAGTAAPSGAGFTTATPTGFRNLTAATKGGAFNFAYFAVGPQRANINVVRGSSGGMTDMNAVVLIELRTVKRIFPSAHQFSPVGSLMIDGAPARTIDFLNTAAGRRLHQRQIYVVHGGALYVITFTAISSSFASQTNSLNQLLTAWRWS